jgi:hypothetical protein
MRREPRRARGQRDFSALKAEENSRSTQSWRHLRENSCVVCLREFRMAVGSTKQLVELVCNTVFLDAGWSTYSASGGAQQYATLSLLKIYATDNWHFMYGNK